MFEHIRQYGLMDAGGILYRPRAYGHPQPDGTWDGWVVFFPLGGGTAIAPPGPETTQNTLAALAVWAAGLTPVYLEGTLAAIEEEAAKVEANTHEEAARYARAIAADAKRRRRSAQAEAMPGRQRKRRATNRKK